MTKESGAERSPGRRFPEIGTIGRVGSDGSRIRLPTGNCVTFGAACAGIKSNGDELLATLESPKGAFMNRRISRCSGAVRALVTATLVVGALCAAGAIASAAPVVAFSHKDGSGTLDLGKVEVAGTVSSSQTVTLTNSGDASATNVQVMVTAGGSDFAIANLSSSTLTTSADVTFDVVCDPSQSGDLTGTVSINWTENGGSALTFDVTCYGPPLWFVGASDPIAFGNREVGTSSPTTDVTVRNDSGASIDITGLGETGSNCGDFGEIVGSTTLAAGATTTVSITFSPTARGTRSCTLTLQDSDSGTTDNSTGMTGTGVAALLARSPGSLSFGSHRVGTSPTMTFTISNPSTDSTGCGAAANQACDLDISGITIAGTNASEFSVNPSTATIAPGGSSIFTVTFNPASPAGSKSALANIDANEPSMLGPVDGSVTLTGTATEALLTTSASTVNFGTVRINGGVSNQSVNMQNPGANTVTVNGITLTTGDTTQFSIQSAVPPPNITIAGGNSSTVNLRCDPSAIGAKTTKLHITSDDDGPSPDEVTLNCTGGRSYVSVGSTVDVDFGDVLVGSTGSVGNSITNLNSTNVLPLNATFTTASPFSTTIAGVTGLAAGSTTNFQIRFSPTMTGVFNGTLVITSDDPVTPSITINLTGRGVKPVATLVLPASGVLNFGNVQVNSTSGGQTVRVRNDGSSNLTITSVSRIGTNPGQFAHSPATPPNVVLAPGASADWTVTCHPTSVGAKSATLRIVNDDGSNSPIDVPLSCTGVQAALVVSPSPVNFGDVRVCENKEIDVTLQNQGTADLNVNGLTLSSARYTIVSGLPTPTITPGGSTVERIRFTPTAGGNADGTLTIQSDDPNSPTVVNLLANGVVAQMGVNATTHDFGDVRVDQTFPTQIFTITNNGSANFQIMSLALSDTTNFAVQPISPATLPASLTPTQTATFRVTARPQSLGAKSATITINTDIPAAPCGMATTVVSVAANGVVPDASFTPTTVAFGPQDVQASPAMQNITVMNTGTAPLEVSDLVLSGAASARYTVSSNALPFTIPVSSSAVVQVTYTPVTVSSGDDASLRIVTDAQSGMNMDIPLSGRGIDREIVPSVTSLDFPDTYRNSDNPPTLQVKIDNAGEAPLAIQMVSKTGGGENAFTLVNQLDSTIAGLANSTLTVQFDPGSGGDFAATLVIMNDDDQRPRVEIALNGRGVVPNFMPDRGDYDMTAGDCDLTSANPTGCIGVGIPTKLTAAIPDGIRFTNLEPQAFRVRELRLVDDDGAPVNQSLFRIINFQSEEIGPNQVYSVDVEFTAPEPGDYHATLEVYLDNDPERVVFVTVRATAVEVRLRGGGCDAGAGGAGLGAALLLLLAAGLLRRRRAAALVAGLALLLAAAPARADRTRNLDLTTFRPMPEVEWEMLSVESPRVGQPGAWFLGLFLDHSVNPLNLESPQIQGMSDALVSQRTSFDLAFAYAFGGRFEAGALVPMLQQSGSDSTVVRGVDSAQGFSLGDIALHGKARIYDASPLSLAAAATVTVPTSTSGEFAGVGGPTAHAQLIGGLDISRISIAANAGFRLRGSGEFGDLHQGNEITYAVATSYRVQRQVWAIGELFGSFGLSRQGSTQGVSPLEWALGARYRMTREVSFGAGFGAGLMGGIGAPDFRGFALVAYTPHASSIGQLPVTGNVPVVDNGDDDGDGIINSKDKCPQQAEDKDGFQDEDGCPDPDNDNDGFPDGSDPCPMAAEDKDGFKDDDGCPDEDNDEDGIPDAQDKCPDEPEDKDGFQDRDGCDDPDNDNDGIPDVIDQCALEPETINGKDDDDGCPDEGESLVMVMPDRIEVFEPIRFAGSSDRISKKSHNVLGQVAATLRANRDFIRVRIAVHVQPRNSHDLELTQARAKAVRQWLIQWGIEPERLETKGFGSTRPLVPKNKRGAAKVNDRVEFIILEKKIK